MRAATVSRLRRVVLLGLVLAAPASAQLTREGVTSLTDTEFWRIFSTMSEPGGTFASENFVSNEMTFQHVIPELQKTVRPDGVYLGVGPEQNFTYIANLKPRLAIIFDIRRQNAMAHLMYKALFELSPTRADFVSRLFSRPLSGRVAPSARVDDLFAVATASERSDSAFIANQRAVLTQLVDKHRFALTPGDSAAIEYLMEVFYEAGTSINYSYRRGRPGFVAPNYPTYATLQTRTNADSVQMAFLASEDLYRSVREMHLRNLIVPVVGDFAGPKAIRAVGDYLKQRNLTVQAFYLSNVEQYLFQNAVADRFYQNVATLPIDTTSMFIRSVPPNGAGGGSGSFSIATGTGGRLSIGSSSSSITINNGVMSSYMVYDSAGFRWLRATVDSAGIAVTRVYRDSANVMVLQRTDSARSSGFGSTYPAPVRVIPMPNPPPPVPFGAPARATYSVSGGSLVSGIAPIGKTLESFSGGHVNRYPDIIAMTRIGGWR